MSSPSERLAGLDAMVLDFNRTAPSRSVMSATTPEDVSWVVIPRAVRKNKGPPGRAPLGDKTHEFNIVSVPHIPCLEISMPIGHCIGKPLSFIWNSIPRAAGFYDLSRRIWGICTKPTKPDQPSIYIVSPSAISSANIFITVTLFSRFLSEFNHTSARANPPCAFGSSVVHSTPICFPFTHVQQGESCDQ
jgi:hypothetical protein